MGLLVGEKRLIVDDYRMERVAQGCAGCEKAFEVEEAYYSTIVDGEECFVRRDYCLDCWREELAARTFSSWKTRVPREARNQAPRLDLDQIRGFFEKLVTSTARHHREMGYVLALILLRKRKLRFLDDEAMLKQYGIKRDEVRAAEKDARKAIASLGRETAPGSEDDGQAEAPGKAPRQHDTTRGGSAPAADPRPEDHDEWTLLSLLDPKKKRVYHVAAPRAFSEEKVAELNDELLLLMSAPAPKE